MRILSYITELPFRLLSHLPLGVLYVLSDVSYFVVRYVARYRLRVVRGNIARAFPEKSTKEQAALVRDFYHFLCDYAYETIKLLTISPDEMRRRMTFEGVEEMEQALGAHPFVFLYLGHYCNWEWVSSFPQWTTHPETHSAQLYRPLNNKAFERLFQDLRTRFGAENIDKNRALRRIMEMKAQGEKCIIGFISDQCPKRGDIHLWVDFLHQDTPVFTGTERIARKVDAAIFFADIRRVRRGYYACTCRPLNADVTSAEEHDVTREYMRMLEEMIVRQPHLWLWSHRRWKHERA